MKSTILGLLVAAALPLAAAPPIRVMLLDGEQAGPFLFVPGAAHHPDGAGQRSERVLELMRHIGGETLDGVDPVIESDGHGAQRVGQVADLVGAFGEVGNLGARTAVL